jgi:hypothetical protein
MCATKLRRGRIGVPWHVLSNGGASGVQAVVVQCALRNVCVAGSIMIAER